jgi:hypothetical protein
MSKKSKSAAKLRRKSLKAGRKAAERAKYEAWSKSGQNSSKRSKLRNKRASGKVRAKRHKEGPCGNIGCSIDNPMDYNLLSPRLLATQHKH